MAFHSGSRLGPYEVTAVLGAGGMGEVYRARDSRLQRDVAVKVLPEVFCIDADMLARFAREAQVLAQLNHPNIAAVYGLEEAGSGRALVMELVEGPTLAELIDAAGREGRGLPIADVVDIARQVAHAMEAAHEQGIIHRDLKPGNVKVRPDGTVKVLDFGLAKAFDPAASASGSQATFNSPTLSIRATQAGLILGTAAYMSPEQAKGKVVDRRADIWAFGVVVLEMLSGRPMYTGETVSEILARVIEREPDLSQLPAETPRRLRDLLRRCLMKDPRARLRDIGEARIALDEIATSGADAEPAPTPAAIERMAPAWRRLVPWGVAVISVALAGVAAWSPWRSAPASPLPIRISGELGAAGTLGNWVSVAVSPDGSTVAFVIAGTPGADQGVIHVRRLDQAEASPLAGTAGARHPFFSPNGEWIAFFADRKLKKVAVSGGAPINLCDAPGDRGGAWGEDGTIVFAASNRSGLSRVPAAGGTPQPFSTLDAARGEITHRFPAFIAGTDAVLYMAHTSGSSFDQADIVVQRLSGGGRHTIRKGGVFPLYLRSGYLGFVQDGTLFAEPFDVETLKSTGGAFPVVEGIRSTNSSGFAQLSLSTNGTLVYVRGGSEERDAVLVSVDAGGGHQRIRSQPMQAATVAIAPDGQRVALDMLNGTDTDVWIYEPARDVLTRLTSEPTEETKPTWVPDGTRIAYAVAGTKDGKYAIAVRNADSSGAAQILLESQVRVYPSSWHPTGKFLAYVEGGGGASADVKILPLETNAAGDWTAGTPSSFVATPFGEHEPVFSPDGRWLAYMSNHSGGRYEVYVRPFPGPGGQVQLSVNGGLVPAWGPRGHQIYFVDREQVPMVASYTVAGGAFRPEKPRAWADVRVASRGAFRSFDLYPDGKRMLMLHDPENQNRITDRVTYLFNAFEEVRRRAPRK